jgi:TetR/AcrR family transcriptional repressor of nem operon
LETNRFGGDIAMRVSREAAAESKSRVVRAASKMLRERGVDAASIADVMQASGMTHGGFYKHFESKNDLVRAAVRFAFDDIVARFDGRKAENGEAAAVTAYVAEYLSKEHTADAGLGCPVAALGADAGRHSVWLGGEFAAGAEQLIARISKAIEKSSRDKRRARSAAIQILTQLVGAVVVARAFGQGPLQDEILAACADGLSQNAEMHSPSRTKPPAQIKSKRAN